MKLRHVLLAALSCIVLVGAQGNGGGMNGGGTDTGMNGGTDGGMNGGMDSMMIRGTIESFDSTDSMLIVRSDTTTDTVYINEQTKMAGKKVKLTQGEKVIVKYQMQDDRKVATQIMAGKKPKKEKSKQEDTTTAPGTPGES